MHTERAIDVEIINLSGGLFDRMLVIAPFEPVPEVVVPIRRAARAQAWRAHVASQVVGAVAATVLVGGVAAAYQVAPAAPAARKDAPSPPRAAAHMAAPAPHCGARVIAASAAGVSVSPEDTPATPVAPAAPRLPASRVAAPATHREGMEALAAIPVVAPTPSPLEALGAPRTRFDHVVAAVAVADAGRGAGACLAHDARRTVRARVTFSPSGHARSAALEGGPFVAEACITAALRGARVRPFEGGAVTVSTTVRL